MITAEQLIQARLRAGYTSQESLARALNVSPRTVGTWEREGVSARGEHAVRELLWPSPAPLAHYSDYELLSEIGRRLGRLSRIPESDYGQLDDTPEAYVVSSDTRLNPRGRRAPAQGTASDPSPRSRRRRGNDAHQDDDL